MAFAHSLSYFSTRFVQPVVMLAGAWFVVSGQLSAGGFVGFLLLLGVFFRPLEKISAVIETYPKGIAGFQRYQDFLSTQPDIADRSDAQDAGRLRGQISYQAVDFAYGRLDASEAEIITAIDNARLGSFLASLPDGLDTIIGERGVRLSGGQKQRLSIARVFLRNPPILILDEATSALDTETERAIRESLDALAEGRTTLIIAHRLATVFNADRIVVVNDGRVVEQGSHKALMDIESGQYRRLHQSQFNSSALL